MPQAKGAAARFSWVAEVTRGTTPASPSMKQLSAAVYGESFGQDIGSVMSRSIKATRGRPTPRGGEVNVGGSIPFEVAPLGLASILYQALGSKTTSGAGPYTHVLKRGALPPGITIEKGFTDLGHYFQYPGCLINALNVNINPENSLVEGSLDVIAMGVPTTSATLGTPTVPVHTPYAEFEAAFTEGGGAVTVLNYGLSYSNDIERVAACGSRYAAALNEGEGMCDVDLTLMFENMTHVNKLLNETETACQCTLTAGANTMTLLLPKLKYFGNSVPKIATSQGIVVQLRGTAYYDSVEQTDLKVTVVNTEATI